MIRYYLIFAFAVCSTMWSQTISIRYEQKIVVDETKFETTINAFLSANENQSLYEEDFTNQKTKTAKNDESQTGVLKTEENPHYYTDIKSGITTYNDFVAHDQDLIVEDRVSFDWTITGKTKQILGYDCQEATTQFRSRDYVAYFTAKLPLNAGPWKFHSLPGVILEIKAKDGAFEITAQKIEVSKKKVPISWPFGSAKPISFIEFKQLYKKRYDALSAYRSEDGVGRYIPKRRTEQLVEE